MNLVNEIKQAQIHARKNKEKTRSSILTLLYSEIVSIGKNNGNRETTDGESIKVIKSFIKNINEVKDNLLKKEQTDTIKLKVQVAINEISICEMFLPKQMHPDELKMAIDQILSKEENKSMKVMGKVMGILNKEYTGLFDGKDASLILREKLK